MRILVTPLSHVEAAVAAHRPSHLITLLDPQHPIETPAGIAPERHLQLGIWDISSPAEGMTLAAAADVDRILSFGASWDAAAPLLVHCWAGISRSTATAFMLACARNPHAPELDIARALRRAAPHAYPNRRLVQLADEALGRRGRMVEAIEAIGPNDLSVIGTPFEIPARF
jgi:predicted protein tyrosine phosphatase